MTAYSNEVTLDRNSILSHKKYSKYSYLYTDANNQHILENTPVVYPCINETTEELILRIAKIVYKEYIQFYKEDGVITKVTYENFPHIKTNTGKLIPSNGFNIYVS